MKNEAFESNSISREDPEERRAIRLRVADELRQEMEKLSLEARDLILEQPPVKLLGYATSEFHSAMMHLSDEKEGSHQRKEIIKTYQLALEYMHAVWSCHAVLAEETKEVDATAIAELHSIFAKLEAKTMLYCMASSAASIDDSEGQSADTEFHAKSSWTLIRGHRYQVLEEEFFSFALAPHSDALKVAYGIGHAEIAAGIQRIADAFRTGVSRAALNLNAAMDRAYCMAEETGRKLEAVLDRLEAEQPDYMDQVRDCFQDLLLGGVCNLTRHSGLPAALLDDLSFTPGENTDFFAPGDFIGTPMRTLPARSRPGIKLGGSVYATDGQFVRDSAYRAIQWGLWRRSPYRNDWIARQGRLVEEAYPNIFAHQLRNAQKFENVFYKDVETGKWVESDLLLLVDDSLLVIEGKAGVMPMQSPATNFASHERTINELIGNAFMQCKRFIEYLASAPEVPLYSRDSGTYVEVARIKHEQFRTILPIGLTIEAFTPFSAMAKELPGITPIISAHPFVPCQSTTCLF